MRDRGTRPFLLEGNRVDVRLAEPDDVDAIIAFFAANEAHLTPYGAACSREHLTRQHWSDQIERRRIEFFHDESCKTFIFLRDDGGIAGTANLSAIVRGPFQAAYLGYALAEKAQGKGLMHEALALLLRFAFAELNLHRIMANFVPSNERSRAVLERLGFTVEGHANDYLRINGAWREHVLTSLTNPAWRS
ncbi:MAG TPA: GNAT family N-acetyltransferase [Candidatus Eremiobacteraceae bacterium]|nr:GNAT family N-acetyltransferase [Candidatus Eremiobacteraceae bacterium]